MIHDDDAGNRQAGLIQRDLVRLLRYLDQLESNQPSVHIITLAFAISSLAYLHRMDRDELHDLVGAIIDEFDFDEADPLKH